MMDVQTALEIADRMDRLARCANRFGYDRDRLLEEIAFVAENYRTIAAYTEQRMEQEMG